MNTNERLQWGFIGILVVVVGFGLWFGNSMYRLELNIYNATVIHNQILKPYILKAQQQQLAQQQAELQKQVQQLPTISGTAQ